MTETTYGYVRVSTQEQNEARQLAAMQEFGVAEKNIIIEKAVVKINKYHQPKRWFISVPIGT